MNGSAAIESLNQTSSQYENNLCIHSKLEYFAKQTPDQIALSQGNKKLTYKQLNDLSNGLANKFLISGLSTEDYVLVCLERSFELMIAIYGILKAGGVYVPVLPSYPDERKNFIIEDCKPKILITTRDTSFPTDKIPVIYMEDFLGEKNNNNAPPEATIKSTNLAYLIYTSGTTGTPKGVMIEHHSVMNRIGWMQKAYPIHSSDVLMQKTSIAFDVSVWELFWWSFAGAGLFLLNPGDEKDPKQILKQIGTNKVSVIHFVPSMLNVFISYLKSTTDKQYLANLKYIFCSGEALTVQSVKNLWSELHYSGSEARIINLYGPTEATVDVTCYECSGFENDTIPIGRPIDNTQIFIVNESHQILPTGEKGELLITGVNLARGYLNRDELNREKFIYLDINGVRLRAYKTGDIAYWDYDCNLIYSGRNDNQIKLRGFRIELGEIESKLRTYSKIKDCAIVANNLNQEDATLVAFCVKQPDNSTSEEHINDYLRRYLPDYMVPSQIFFINQIPTTVNGKLDKRALIQIIENGDLKNINSSQNSFSNNIEQKVYQIWCNLLNKKNISFDSNFFDLGGNSLLIVQMSILLNSEFNLNINVFELFQHTNIIGISTFIKDRLNQR